MIRQLAWRYAPLPVLQFGVSWAGGLRAKERLGLLSRPWYAYGLLSAADHALKVGHDHIWALEFGVAAGRGLRNLQTLARAISADTGVRIRIAGFDTGTGMPPSTDYRDHPERYHPGDYPMIDHAQLKRDLDDDALLILGDISETVDTFTASLDGRCPVGFVAVDVDTYTSSKAALRLFGGAADNYLPMTWCYFDDCSSRSHFTRFTGELLSIEEFNSEYQLRKIDVDRGAWNAHRKLGPQIWYERMFIMHAFDHPWRTATKLRDRKVISPV